MIIRYKDSAQLRGEALQFEVPLESRLFSSWKSLVAIFSPIEKTNSKYSSRMFQVLDSRWVHTPARSFLGSSVINIGIVFFLVWVSQKVVISPDASNASVRQQYEIYYVPPKVSAVRVVPRIAPAGPGGIPGQGDLQREVPQRGSTVFHSILSAISQPLRPDNSHQTIIQPNIPPDVRSTKDLALPNLVLASAPARPKAPPIPWHAPAPSRAKSKQVDLAPPSVAATSPDSTLVVLGPSTSAPAMPVVQPVPSGGPSIQRSDLASENAIPGGFSGAENGGLVVLSTDPNASGSLSGLPVGNRAASFSLSPYGTATGSPGGTSGGAAGSGHGAKGSGGDGSVGVGTGKKGGGGGGDGTDSGIVSVNGVGSATGGRTLPMPSPAEEMIIPMDGASRMRKNALIVSTGLMGGGGLGVYQALSCRKIYTIFLPMPGANWTLQYCLLNESASEEPAATAGINTTVRMQQGLVPPSPELQFDFKRLPVPPEKARKMIILKGTILEDGTVSNAQVYAGVLPLMDEAARLAFSRWKFSPALRLGKAVSVQILVGIAVTPPKS